MDEMNVFIISEMDKLFSKELIEQSEITVLDKKVKEFQINLLLKNKMEKNKI